MPSGLRILYIAARFPYPPVQGDRLRAYHQIRLLSRNHRITLLAPLEPGEGEREIAAMRPLCEQIVTLPVSDWRRAAHLPQAILKPLPLQTIYWYDGRFGRSARALTRDNRFDLLHVQLLRMAPVITAVPELPKVIDLCDALSLSFLRQSRHRSFPMNLIYRWEAKRLRRYEQALLAEFDAGIVISPADREALGNHPSLFISRNGINAPPTEMASDSSGADRAVVIFGRMDYFPNADAAVWFARRIFPKIRQVAPDVELWIAGGRPRRSVRRLARLPGVKIWGNVANMRELVIRATVAAAPLRCGAGTQNKVLEAMAWGVPVVATGMVARGACATPGKHLLAADNEQDFATAVIELLRNPELRNRLVSSARSFVTREFTWEKSASELERAYESAILNKKNSQRDIGSRRVFATPEVTCGRRTAIPRVQSPPNLYQGHWQ